MPTQEIRNFWDKTREQLAEVEMDPRVELVEDADSFTEEGRIKSRTIYRVTMTSFGGKRIRAWYATPSGHPPRHGWPAIMEVPGYAGVMPLPVHLLQYGYATLSLFPRSQGESLHEWEIEHSTRLVYNITDRDSYYYRGAYMDCVRGLDFLCSRPEVDTDRIGVLGFSQGGGLTLATAALDHRVSAAAAGVPWLCNFPVAADITSSPYVELHDYLQEHPQKREAVLENLTYFDQLSLTDAIECPTIVGASTIDDVHPLSTVMPVFEKIRSMKSIVIYPDLDHEYRTDFTQQGKTWMDRYLR